MRDFLGKIKNIIINLSSAVLSSVVFAQRVVTVKELFCNASNNPKIQEDDILKYFFFFYWSEKIRLDISCELYAMQ